MKISRPLLLLFSCTLFLASVSAQEDWYEMTRYADDVGLTSRIVRDVCQDQNGFIWIAGQNGLFKFDGHSFKSFFAPLRDTSGLRSNYISSLICAKDNRIWVASASGLHVVERDTVHFVPLQNDTSAYTQGITSLYEDADGAIWVGTYQGLYRVADGSVGLDSLVTTHIPAIPAYSVWGMRADAEGRIWLCARQGVYRQSAAGEETFDLLHLELDGLNRQDVNLFNVHHYRQDLLLVASTAGILRGEIRDDSTLYLVNFRDANGATVAGDFIYHSIIDNRGRLWTATWQNWCHQYEVRGDSLVEIPINSANGWLDMGNHCISIFQDRQGNIWVPNGNGLHKIVLHTGKLLQFPRPDQAECLGDDRFTVTALCEGRADYLWLTTNRGLYRFLKSDLLRAECPSDFLHFDDPDYHNASGLFIDSQERLWMTSRKGVFLADLSDDPSSLAFTNITTEDGLKHNWTTQVIEEDANTFWLGTYDGLVRITILNQSPLQLEIKVYQSDTKRADGLVNNWVQNLARDAEGNLWIGTPGGLSKMISATGAGSFANYNREFGNFNTLSSNAVKDLFLDREGGLWVGTQHGLNLYTPETDGFQLFGTTDGLPSSYILGIRQDREGFIWLTTTTGVLKTQYNATSRSLSESTHYTTRLGLADNISNRNAIFIDRENRVYIGSSAGVSIISSQQDTAGARSFRMVLTEVATNRPGQAGFFPIEAVDTLEGIDLSYRENTLRIRYAALDLTDESFNRYRHKITPGNAEWVNTENQAELSLYNLAPGRYQIWLDGANNEGDWSGQPLRLDVRIRPPIWRTGWAIGLYALAFLGTLWYFYRRRIREKVKALEQERQLERALLQEREELRRENTADFHDELGAKVTKISLFLALAERSLADRESPEDWLGKIRKTLKELSGSYRDLLWVIDPQKDTLEDTFLRLRDFGEDLFGATEIRFRTKGLSTSFSNISLDPPTKKHVVFIFKEAMNNCLKYAGCRSVELHLKQETGLPVIELVDDGKGFDPATATAGRGLKNMQNRAEKIGATLEITSSSVGTRVRLLRIPHSGDVGIPEEA